MGEVFQRPDGSYRIDTLDADGNKISFSVDEKTYQTLVEHGRVKPNNQPGPGPIANTVGLIVPKTLPNLAGSGAMPSDASKTESESYWDKFKNGVKDGAQYYKDNVSQGMHDFAGSAMDKGGTIATVGGGAAAVGGGMVATGIGAVPGAAIATGGAATAAVGGGVAAVGGVTETAATVLDKAAEMVITGQTPDLVGPAISLGSRLLDRLIARRIPGMGKGGNKKDAPATPNPAGGYVTGRGRCDVRRYKDKCPDGRTPHHLVGDHSFKQLGDAGGYYPAGSKYPNGFKHADGWAVCAGGKTKSSAPDGKRIKKGAFATVKDWFGALDQHGQIHAIFDLEEIALGAVGDAKGTTSLGALEIAGATAAATVLGCDKAAMIKDLQDKHRADGLPADMKVRADPFGAVRNLDPAQMGTGRVGGSGGKE